MFKLGLYSIGVGMSALTSTGHCLRSAVIEFCSQG